MSYRENNRQNNRGQTDGRGRGRGGRGGGRGNSGSRSDGKDYTFLKNNMDYYGKFLEAERRANMWNKNGQYKLGKEYQRRANCLMVGNVKGYESFIPEEECFTITKKYSYLLPENRGTLVKNTENYTDKLSYLKKTELEY